MTRINVISKSSYGKSIGFSRAVRIGNVIAVSGTAPVGPDGKPVFPGDLYNQTKYCFEIIANAIAEAGGTLADVIRTRVYLADINRWQEAGKAHGEVFNKVMPACTFVEVKGLIEKEWLVEIEAECVLGGQDRE